MALRVRLAGDIALEVDGTAVATTGVGPLGRVAFAYLVVQRHRPVARDELAEVLWGPEPPPSWETSLRVLVSKVRSFLGRAGLAADDALLARFGCYELHLPAGTAVDVEEVAEALEVAEQAMADERPEEAVQAASRAVALAARRFLPGGAGTWVEHQQAVLRQQHLRGLETLAAAATATGAWASAVQAADEAVTLEPFREPAWVRLMAAHAGAGRPGEALRAYERCRRHLVEELGLSPSPATEAAYLALLGDEAGGAGQAEGGPSPAHGAAGRPRAPTGPAPLPAPLNSFVGRQDDLDEVTRLLSRSRLVTLTGAGGVGKTRLAVEAARSQRESFQDGVALVELAPVSDHRLVGAHVMAAWGLAEEAGRTPVATLVAGLGERRVLLVLDNCEHVLGACAVLAETLLSRCPELRILATSREPLRISPETTLRVRSLSVPQPDAAGQPPPVEELLGYEAVRLLVERTAAVSPGFELTDDNASAAVRICRELDGIPLALELAAARGGTLSLVDIAERLDDRFRLLSIGPRTAPPRHRTLRGAVDWSYDALDGEHQRAFRRLSVFAGDFTLEAAEHLWAAPDEPKVLDLVTGLVDSSVLVADPARGTTRFRLPETMRRYARAKLAAAGETDAVAAHLLAWATDLAEAAERGLLGGGDQAVWLDRLETEQDNLRAALGWATSPASPAGTALALAGALGRFWEVRGRLTEGRRWLDAACTHDDGSRPALRAKALNWAGILAQRQGDNGQAHARYRESLAIMRSLGDKAGMAASLHGLGNLCALQGDPTARFFFEESLAIGHELGDQQTVAASLANLGWVAHNQGDLVAARAFYEESLALRRELGDRHGVAMLLGNLGFLAFQQGDHETARHLDEESLALRRELGDRHGVAMLLGNLGHLAFQEGDDGTARSLYDQCLSLRRELGDRHGEAGAIANLADLARAQGDLGAARRLLEDALAVAEALGDRYRQATLLVRLGRLATHGGDLAEAESLHHRALRATGDVLPRTTVAEWLEGLAAVAAGRHDAGRAVRLLGAADALRRSMGVPVPPREAPAHEQRLSEARAVLGDEAFRTAWCEGRGLSMEEAISQGRRDDPVTPR